MTNQHPITPPPELVWEWTSLANEEDGDEVWISITTQAARWGADQQLKLDAEQIAQAYQKGADQELEACCVEVAWLESSETAKRMRERRRPKPPSLKEQALTALHAVATGANDTREQHQDLDTIRRALEAFPDA
jgi:hypothetical protein